MAATCDNCGGTGAVTPKGSECGTCGGAGVVKEAKTVKIPIPPGVEDGMRLSIGGEGDAPPAGAPGKPRRGDLVVNLRVLSHESFRRHGADILYTAKVPVTTALLGGKVRIPTLDGELELRVPPGANTGDTVSINGMGIKRIEGRGTGNLKVEFKLQMPR